MKRSGQSARSVMLPAFLSGFVFLSVMGVAAIDRKDSVPSKSEDAIKPLIVMIKSRLADGWEVGAGIIFGQTANRLYIVTANHVVRQGAQESKDVRVRFTWLPGEEYEAKLLEDANREMDWAVLAVGNLDKLNLPAGGLPFAQLGDSNSLQRKDKVYLIGNPTGHSWDITVAPDSVTGKADNSILFNSVHLEPGHSGGALLDENWGVVGLIKSSQAPHGEAINIQSLLETLSKRGYPVSLKPSDTKAALSAAAASAPMSPAEIAKSYTSSTVYIEAGWKLIYTSNSGQVYHKFIPNQWRDQQGNLHYILLDGRSSVATYVLVGQNTVEPLLTLDNRAGPPIGGEHSGTGFAVTSDGFILTNRRVGAAWRTSYNFPASATPGVVISNGAIQLKPDGTPLLVAAPAYWVPSETKQAGQTLQGGFDGRNDYLNLTFPKNELRIPGKVARTSDRHDVAMLKIDVPDSVPKVELNDNYDTIKPGDVSIVLGYPGVSPAVYGVVRSQDGFNREAQLKIIPDPTISVGNIGRVIRGKDMIYSGFGDAYELTINSTGAGSSGAPVFDDHGRVTGIIFAGRSLGGASVTYAVPIRYGKELMNVSAPR